MRTAPVLGGSWVVINGVINRVTILISHVRGLITPLIPTHAPPSSEVGSGRSDRRGDSLTGGKGHHSSPQP